MNRLHSTGRSDFRRFRIRITALLWVTGMFPIFAGTSSTADDGAETVSADGLPIVVMASGGPVLINLQVLVDDLPYRLWVARFLAQRVDADGDGRLTPAELDSIPERLRKQTNAAAAENMVRAVESAANADSADAQKFAEWFAEQLRRSLNVVAGAVQASEAVRLAAFLDQNGDGNVGREELTDGVRSLRFRDLDDDQTYSAAELLPFRDPRNQRAALVPDVADLPFVQMTDTDAVSRAAQQILKRCGQSDRRHAGNDSSDTAEAEAHVDTPLAELQTIDIAKLRLPPDDVSSFDQDHNSVLDPTELQHFLTRPV
ncbi:MAG: hypothetical protein KDA89_10675, partial [Planctomycetaceae bacterium]|nr:hypothetical protein [Planctomycetaceae bacterium]